MARNIQQFLMRTIIAGSRDIDLPVAESSRLISQAVAEAGWMPTTVLSGGARGIDRAAEHWARSRLIPLEVYPADWKLFGAHAGSVRNHQMALKAQALIAIWDGRSTGTANMIERARSEGLKVYVKIRDIPTPKIRALPR